MYTFIKGLGTKSIVTAVCVIILVLAGSVRFLYNANNSKLTENATLKADNVVMQQNEVFTEKSAVITDQTVTKMVDDSVKAKTATEKLRKESQHEYAKKVVPAASEGVSANSDPNGDERAGIVAGGLLKNYCRIRPEDPDCRALGSAVGLPDR
ncbi:virion structural protein [Pseudomonas phage 201phi2-1]|uniref:Virion structural protein n=1 Tax=Pseudomonas phage 201phi2-1 TaxID=198110 RepID=B3FJ88_BP201|nr:virion structural protein [Pseudomonas phage 201phi2-1]ABY63055.1 virion structural protein [Pseudomonas phage 201phi2-1]